jgi:DNA-binding MarR family transcriptional regulator
MLRLDKLMRRYQARETARVGTEMDSSRGQGRVLTLLKMQQKIGQQALWYLLDMSRQGLSETLLKLEKNGYITRTKSDKDKRSQIIEITEAGRKVTIGNIRDEETGLGDVFDCLTDDEQATLTGYFARIIEHVNELVDDTEDDYAAFVRERFLQEHGFEGRRAPWFVRDGVFGRGRGRNGLGQGRDGFDGHGKRDGHGEHGGRDGHGKRNERDNRGRQNGRSRGDMRGSRNGGGARNNNGRNGSDEKFEPFGQYDFDEFGGAYDDYDE